MDCIDDFLPLHLYNQLPQERGDGGALPLRQPAVVVDELPRRSARHDGLREYPYLLQIFIHK